MAIIPFTANQTFSVGVEIEFQLLDPTTFDLIPKCPKILKQVPKNKQKNFKVEFFQSMLEVATNKCNSISEVADNLYNLTTNLDVFCSSIDCLPYSASLHPFATLKQLSISDNDRYHRIMDDLQIVGKRLITQGLHVHIGLSDAETTINVCNSIRQYLPVLLALTASSPFYLKDDTGFQSYRTKLFESLPRSGIPSSIANWNTFENYVALLTRLKVIKSSQEIWWDVRPHPQLGTIEIRICDLPSRLSEIVGITAVVQALVATLAKTKQHNDQCFNIILNNKWQASRYGTSATFIDEKSATTKSAYCIFEELLDFIEPQLKTFNSVRYTDALTPIFDIGNPAERYRTLYKKTHNHPDCIKQTQGEFDS